MAKHLDKKPDDLREKIRILPETPGVYMYYDSGGTVIYVGKAKNLKRRVTSYFNRTHDRLRTNLLVRAIADMTYIVVPTEPDALNLESSMIKEYQPRYNVLLKDDKSYPWICVTSEMYPRVFMTRNRLRDGSKYYGPYTDGNAVKSVLAIIKELYPLRTCKTLITPEFIDRGKGRLCLSYHMHRCKGCCKGLVLSEVYNAYIDRVKQILRGETRELMDYLRAEMERLSMALKFEEAQELKIQYEAVARYQARSVIISQTIEDIDVFGVDEDDDDVFVNYMHVRRGAVVKSLTLQYRRMMAESVGEMIAYAMQEVKDVTGIVYDEVIVPVVPDIKMDGVTFTVPQRGDKAKLLEVSEKNARQYKIDALKHLDNLDPEQRTERVLERIKKDFRLSELPRHIECFDNSNTQGTNPVASCVVFKNARPSKRDYRHFNNKTVEGPEEFASKKDVLIRRYTPQMQEGEGLPQLIVVDGGKGQLSSAVEALEEIGLRGVIAVVGIAKRLEEIYFPGDSVPLYIDKNSESLRVVQQLRDEAHRFGITHHRNRRSKSQLVSELDGIKGIGEVTRAELFKKFKSVRRMKDATLEMLIDAVGSSKGRILYDAFHATLGDDANLK